MQVISSWQLVTWQRFAGDTLFRTDFLALQRLLEVEAALQNTLVADGNLDAWAQRRLTKCIAPGSVPTALSADFWVSSKVRVRICGCASVGAALHLWLGSQRFAMCTCC
jgi:hypothetical protein